MLLEERINNLPFDIKMHIISFTYSPQPTSLTNDIKHFLRSRAIIQEIYYDRWNYDFAFEPGADINWLDNDLVGYMNDNYATMYGYRQKFYNIITRSFCIRNIFQKLCINKITPYNSKYVRSIIDPHFYRQAKFTVKILWGLLTIEERDEFIQLQEN
jgi:hypothetical protein